MRCDAVERRMRVEWSGGCRVRTDSERTDWGNSAIRAACGVFTLPGPVSVAPSVDILATSRSSSKTLYLRYSIVQHVLGAYFPGYFTSSEAIFLVFQPLIR